MRRKMLTFSSMILLALVLAGCGFQASSTGYQDPLAERALARAGATSTVIAAKSEAQATATALKLEQNEQSHRHWLETLPVLLMIGGGVVITLAFGLVAMWLYREQDARRVRETVAQPAPALPMTVHVWNLPATEPGTRRADYWRQIESQVVDSAGRLPDRRD